MLGALGLLEHFMYFVDGKEFGDDADADVIGYSDFGILAGAKSLTSLARIVHGRSWRITSLAEGCGSSGI